MGLWARTGRFTKAALLLAAGALGGGAALAVASVPDSSGVIHACYAVDGTGEPITTGANVRIIDTGAGQTCATNTVGRPAAEHALSWNQQGPAGAQGAQGQPGQQGPQGAAGNTLTVTKGGTLTLAGGQVLSVESAASPITLPTPSRRLPGGSNVVLGSGRGALNLSILNVSLLGSAAAGSGSGGGTGKVSVHDISFTKKIDKSSPSLFQACATGKHFPTVKITLRKAGGKPYLTYTLSNVLVSAIQADGTSGQTTPTEQVTLNFTKVEVKYVAQS